MKLFWYILFVVFFISFPLSAQTVFIAEYIDTNDIKNRNLVISGELVSEDECSVFVNDKDLQDEEQLHIVYENKVISIFPDWHISTEDFFYSNPEPRPFMRSLDISGDMITSGKVLYVDIKSFNFISGEIKDGCIFIEYQQHPKIMTIYFYDLVVAWEKWKR